MTKYQVFARKYRPKTFQEVLGQDAIVTTLKNAIKHQRLAHAYLFCGSRGTGKTTLARVFAKALNCQNPGQDLEPCNVCASCREIASSTSMDVIEIDGASHRGIDDIRQINETVGFAAAAGKNKIYIIDEVHMLTKEAFNALLKTLEEPPPKVMFFFATTEPHKIPTTILSRCQRFNLNRIPVALIMSKLQAITDELKLPIQEEALRLLALSAEGGLRDAESLLDQIVSFHEGEITVDTVHSILGMMPRHCFFALDQAGKEANFAAAFEIAHQVFSQGKNLEHFLESLTEHYRNILLVKLSGANAPFLSLSNEERQQYEVSAKLYSQEQCIAILEILMQAQQQKIFSTGQVALEATLLRILRTHQRISVESLVRRLAELEQKIANTPSAPPIASQPSLPKEIKPQTIPPAPKKETMRQTTLMEDPTPTPAELGIKKPVAPPPQTAPKIVSEKVESAPIELGARPTAEAKQEMLKQQNRYDTLLQFATIELEGTIQKKMYPKF